MDGLVSTGTLIPFTILKRNFANEKNIFMFFINILILTVDKRSKISLQFNLNFFNNADDNFIQSHTMFF
jgi:hypothetical protein